jgi:hypothetical protein
VLATQYDGLSRQIQLLNNGGFQTLTAARSYFSVIRKATLPGTKVADPNRSDILDVYRRYCAATNYPAIDAVEVTTELDNQQRPSGGYNTTKAFAVVTATGETTVFSIDRALAAIAT